MNTLMAVVLWCILFVLCWPLALLVLVMWPIAWLLVLPFRLLGVVFRAVLALLQAIFFLPARILGWDQGQVRTHRAAA